MLGGFDDEAPEITVEERPPEKARFWDLSGSLELTGSVNFVRHRSDTGDDYTGLQRLRQRLNLQLDLDLAPDWQARVDGWGFADAAYLINGAQRYTRQVRNEYPLDAELGEAWIQGELAEWLDLKLGRQVVIWGRSESLRVLDVLNPLDNREPGRVDLEDLRRPVSMLRLDAYHGDWSITGIAIPEIRFDANPVVGSDFFPGTFEPSERVPRAFVDPEFAVAVTTIQSGWDLSLHGAWFWDDRARLDRVFPGPRLEHDRLWLVGAGGNVTTGSWLFKSELAWLSGVGFFAQRDQDRLDALAGVEYYGFRNTSISLEVSVQHLLDYSGAPRLPTGTREARETSEAIAFRVTRSFLRETLDITLLALLLEIDGRDGGIFRADVDYEVLDGLSAGIGVILYEAGQDPVIAAWQRNDRLIFNLKWSF